MNPAPALLAALAFATALATGGRLLVWQAERVPDTGSVFDLLLGESRRAFAMHAFIKADAYFHSGFYPSVFDLAQVADRNKTHLEESIKSAGNEHHDHDAKPAPARDWLEAFGNHFHPSQHRHLERFGDEREILPWLRLAAELDPQRVETYTVAAFWLRDRLNKVNDAEQFLREGLRANPQSYEILYELGRLYAENDRDVPRARAVLELAIERWLKQEARKADPDKQGYGQILAQLADLEERAGNLDRALAHFARLKQVSPAPETVQKRIDELLARQGRPR
ncbi:MAG: hypothetical protein EB141_06630 [Verrucomicrobia bacterium]|nr:hypothetical protein [Verrucomicrobiota bacterium]NBU09355.1 hypothetical protein [Pseudomonadota bacterium]NDA68596.1 hypothetical protein [Verrucomicrobiota bacterium]NDB75308.1 hypothetical protein [Verrucomicrobiota bacterium]NDD40111.1 hypothetical protein [Verrucomicrobiota bacterium]